MNPATTPPAAPPGTGLVIVVRPGVRTRSILAWLRQLVPAALLVVAAPGLPPRAPPDALVLDDEDVEAGPLALADALLRHRGAHGAEGGTASADA